MQIMDEDQKPLIFVLMPFQDEFKELYENGIKPAAERAGASAERVDEQKYKEKDVMEQIIDQIDRADILVGVITGNSPSVFYEIGWAHALYKHVVILTDNTDGIPYDIKHIPSLEYKDIDEALITKLTEHFEWHLSHPTVRDKYYQLFKNSFRDVEEVAGKLMPFFLPIANRYLSEWSEFVKSVVKDGIYMKGPQRLNITRHITFETRKYSIIEQLIGNHTAHSKDWLAFYDEIGNVPDIEKTWMLCAKMDEIAKKQDDVKDAWEYFRDNNFKTLYCSPIDFLEARGEKLPNHQVIEDFGEYIKLLLLPHGDSYKSGERPNQIITTIRNSNNKDQSMWKSMIQCSCVIDEEWFKNIPLMS